MKGFGMTIMWQTIIQQQIQISLEFDFAKIKANLIVMDFGGLDLWQIQLFKWPSIKGRYQKLL